MAIVGGGPGGTYAAYRLRDRGLTIQIFEQHGRLGGRTYSIPIPGMSHKADLGAMRIARFSHRTIVLANAIMIGIGQCQSPCYKDRDRAMSEPML